MKMNDLVSLRLNYFFFIGYLKTGDREGGSSTSEPPEPPLDPPVTNDTVPHFNCNENILIFSSL